MSHAHTATVWELELPTTQKVVLLALCNHADASGLAFPSIARLSRLTGLKDRAIRNAIDALEVSGRIKREARNHRSSLFWLADLSTTTAPDAGDQRHQMPATPAPRAETTAPDAGLTIVIEPLQEARERARSVDNSRIGGLQRLEDVLNESQAPAMQRLRLVASTATQGNGSIEDETATPAPRSESPQRAAKRTQRREASGRFGKGGGWAPA